MTLEHFEGLAERSHPALRRDRALIEAARGTAVQAGLLPNPQFNANNPWVFNGRDSLLNAGVLQEIPVLGKKRLDEAAANEGIRQAEITYQDPTRATTLLLWKPVPGATTYHVMLDYSAYFNRPLVDRSGIAEREVAAALDADRPFGGIDADATHRPEIDNQPSSHTTAISEHATTHTVARQQRLYQRSATVAMASAAAKNDNSGTSPSIMSPTILAKPVIWIVSPSVS